MTVRRPARWTRRWIVAASAIACLARTASPAERATPLRTGSLLQAVVAAEGFDHPVFLTAAPGDTRAFVVEQPGRIRWIENGRPSKRVLLDVSRQVRYGGECGLLGLAFHPGFATNAFLYVDYTDRSGDTQVERYTVRADRDSVVPGSARRILTAVQPFANHNGGMLAFGLDGMLYVLWTGCPWRAVPRAVFGPWQTVYDRFVEWKRAGVFEQIWARCLHLSDQKEGIEWQWQSADGTMVRAPAGGKRRGSQSHRPRKTRL